MPGWRDQVDRIVSDAFDEYDERAISNVIVNGYGVTNERQYETKGIGGHIDSMHFGSSIWTVNLGSDTVIEYTLDERLATRWCKENEQGNENAWVEQKWPAEFRLLTPRRAATQMKGPARHCYKHAIRSVAVDTVCGVRMQRAPRVSITLRTAADPALAPPRGAPIRSTGADESTADESRTGGCYLRKFPRVSDS
eukprot:gene57480-biopygen66260